MSKHQLLLSLLPIFCMIEFSNAQTPPAIEWGKSVGGTLNDAAYAIEQTNDLGYIVAGFSRSNDIDVSGNHGGPDYMITKLNTDGSIQWAKEFGGTEEDKSFSVLQTSDLGYIAAGYTESDDGDVSGNHGNYDFWVLKLDDTGSMLWQKCLGGTSTDQAAAIEQTTDGGYIVTGYTYSNDGDVSGNHGGQDYWVVKLDGSGNIQWQICLGGSDNDIASAVEQTDDGGYIVGGFSRSNDGDVTGHHGTNSEPDYWVVKLDGGGNLVWEKSLGGTADDKAYSIKETSTGDFIVAGFTSSNDGDVSGNHGEIDYWVVKIDAGGSLQWQKCLGGSAYDKARGVFCTDDNGYAVIGYSKSSDGQVTGNHGSADYWITKLDDSGSLEWEKSMGGTGDDEAFAVIQTSASAYSVAGFSDSDNGDVSVNYGENDFWIVRLNFTTNVDEFITSSSFDLYPNPASTQFSLQLNSSATTNSEATITIVNVLGKTIFKKLFDGTNGNLKENILLDEKFSEGIYFVKVTMDQQEMVLPLMVSKH